jgi:hypothetical protein
MNIKVEKVMDRKKVANAIHDILDSGIALLQKERLDQSDNTKVRVLRTLGSHINAAVLMVQQETAQMRMAILVERMKQLGFNDEPVQIKA